MASLLGELVVLSGPFKGRRVPIRTDQLKLGRDKSCDVALEDESSSRLHAEIRNEEGRLVLRDLKSTNGTYLNDARIEEAVLSNGDRVGVGDTIFLFQRAPSAQKPSLQVVFSEENKDITTQVRLRPDETRFLGLEEDADVPEAQRHFARLYEFMLAIAGVLHRPALMERVISFLHRTFEADRGVILLMTPDGDPGPQYVRVREGMKNDGEISISRTLAQQILQKQESFLSSDVESDERLANSESVQRMRVRSALGVPLKLKDRVLGLVYLDRIEAGHPFSKLDLKLCSAMALQAAVCLENSTLYSELLDAAEFNNSMLRSLASGLIVVDRHGMIIRVNKAALEILGKEEGALMRRNLGALEDLAELNRVVQETLKTDRAQDRFEIRVRLADSMVPLGLSTSPLTDHSAKTVGVVANFRNLTQVRQLQEQLRRSQHLAALGQMAAGVAHEIRNPLNSVRGFAQLIQEAAKKEPGPPEFTEYSQVVLEEVDRMNRIVQDLLDFSRQRDLTLVPVQPEGLLADLVKELEPEFQSAQVALAYEKPSDPLPRILGNEDKLRQVFRNILLNALQASKEDGRVEVKLSVAENTVLKRGNDGQTEERLCRELAVSVSDHGVGMSPEILSKIFDPFFTEKEVGTGLGLSISQKIVDQHGGRIEVESERDKGSSFVIYLPVL